MTIANRAAPTMMKITGQSGASNIPDAVAIPLAIMLADVAGKNGPVDEH